MSDCLEHIQKYMSGYPDIVIDNAYEKMGGKLSTVVILDGNKMNIARQGAVIIE